MTCTTCGRQLDQPARGRRRRYCSRSCQARAYRARRDAVAPPRRTARPGRLNRVVITRAAVELADRDGIDGLSMRRLAGALGVATAALYRYFPDRETLLGSMAELVLAEIQPPPDRLTDWRDRLRHEAHAEWQIYRRHPWMLPILARTRPPVGPALFDLLERSFAALDRPELSPKTLFSVYLSLSGLVQGLALLFAADGGDRLGDVTIAEPGPLRDEIAELLDPVTRPVLYRIFVTAPGGLDLALDEILDTGLGLLLDGIRASHPEPTE